MRRALALLCLAPAALASQERVWIDQLYPFAYYSTVDGFWLGGHYGWSSPMTVSTRPEPHFASLRFDAAASTQGSYSVVADAQAPAHWDGWRVGLTFSAARANRLGYYGQGNDTPFESDSVTPANPFLYRVSRTTRGVRLTVQRRLVGPLRVLAGGSLERTDFRELPGDSRFRRDRIAGTVRPEDVPFLSRWARYWNVWVSVAFLRSYLEAARPAGFLPDSKEELRILLDAHLLEKAVYELGYELNNRPDWVGVPVSGILEMLRPAT